MSIIRLQFVRGTGLSSKLIAWWGNGYGGYSHVDGVLSTGELAGARSDAVGGQPPGFRVRPAFYEHWDKRTVVTLTVSDQQAKDWERFLRAQIGDPYDESDILGLIIGQPISSAGHWICSAAQNHALRTIGVMPDLPVPDQQITPNSLLLMVSALRGSVATL